MRSYLFTLFLILLTTSAYAQRSVEITGTVIEKSTNEPIEQATVRLLGEKDSSMIGGVATSSNGPVSVSPAFTLCFLYDKHRGYDP